MSITKIAFWMGKMAASKVDVPPPAKPTAKEKWQEADQYVKQQAPIGGAVIGGGAGVTLGGAAGGYVGGRVGGSYTSRSFLPKAAPVTGAAKSWSPDLARAGMRRGRRIGQVSGGVGGVVSGALLSHAASHTYRNDIPADWQTDRKPDAR